MEAAERTADGRGERLANAGRPMKSVDLPEPIGRDRPHDVGLYAILFLECSESLPEFCHVSNDGPDLFRDECRRLLRTPARREGVLSRVHSEEVVEVVESLLTGRLSLFQRFEPLTEATPELAELLAVGTEEARPVQAGLHTLH